MKREKYTRDTISTSFCNTFRKPFPQRLFQKKDPPHIRSKKRLQIRTFSFLRSQQRILQKFPMAIGSQGKCDKADALQPWLFEQQIQIQIHLYLELLIETLHSNFKRCRPTLWVDPNLLACFQGNANLILSFSFLFFGLLLVSLLVFFCTSSTKSFWLLAAQFYGNLAQVWPG